MPVSTCASHTVCCLLVCVQVRGRLTVQEGRNVQYNGILHAARTILREVRHRHTFMATVLHMETVLQAQQKLQHDWWCGSCSHTPSQ